MPETAVRRNDGASRYEIAVAGETIGFAQFRRRGDVVTFTHTEVRPDHRGQGHSLSLIREALDDVRRQGQRAKPMCEAVAAFIQRNPEYSDLLAA